MPLLVWGTWGDAVVESYAIDSVDRAEVLRYLGYAGQEMTQELEGRINGGVERCLSIGAPRGVWRLFEVEGRGTKEDGTPIVRLSGTSLELLGRSMQEHMDGAVAVGVMAVTVGMGVERELRRLSLTDRVGQVVFDAALTAILDACGYEYVVPRGAFYLWIRALESDAQAFSERAKDLELMLVASDSFGVPGWVRAGTCVSRDTIDRSAPAWAALAASYR